MGLSIKFRTDTTLKLILVPDLLSWVALLEGGLLDFMIQLMLTVTI
jgi:hypothetical protein